MKLTEFIEHPEGGRFREIFRSGKVVTTSTGTQRSALTHIYFSLSEGEVSRFHRVSADEVWNLYRGEGIRIYTWDGAADHISITELSDQADEFCHVVPSGTWQAVEPIGSSVLLGCSVGPGFEFDDFELIAPRSEDAKAIQTIDPDMTRFTAP